ncbi:7535_t:CDS:2 [Cetraspora pellucida]|uniref:7535_t:CDS:1 n=1 Tax=Cetraspora pellucida TaxID=1433469 RepID=A0A9N8ZHF0_9GLOM|nr:7535_t:CDS:2 [Cetraspora pellucida]
MSEKDIPNTPQDYVDLYKECWSDNPDQRPTLLKISKQLKKLSNKASIKFIVNSISSKQCINAIIVNNDQLKFTFEDLDKSANLSYVRRRLSIEKDLMLGRQNVYFYDRFGGKISRDHENNYTLETILIKDGSDFSFYIESDLSKPSFPKIVQLLNLDKGWTIDGEDMKTASKPAFFIKNLHEKDIKMQNEYSINMGERNNVYYQTGNIHLFLKDLQVSTEYIEAIEDALDVNKSVEEQREALNNVGKEYGYFWMKNVKLGRKLQIQVEKMSESASIDQQGIASSNMAYEIFEKEDILREIFIYAELDKIYSCIFVNKLWCETAVPILWQGPFIPNCFPQPDEKAWKSFKHLARTYLLCLTESRYEFLKNEGLTLPSKSSPMFTYLSHLKVLDFSFIYNAADSWIDDENKLIIDENEFEHYREILRKTLIENIIGKANNIQFIHLDGNIQAPILNKDTQSLQDLRRNISEIFESLQSQSGSLSSLVNLSLKEIDFKQDIIDSMNSFFDLKKLQKLEFCKNGHFNQDTVPLITKIIESANQYLQHLELSMVPLSLENKTKIVNTITQNCENLVHLNIRTLSNSEIISILISCQKLRVLKFYTENNFYQVNLIDIAEHLSPSLKTLNIIITTKYYYPSFDSFKSFIENLNINSRLEVLNVIKVGIFQLENESKQLLEKRGIRLNDFKFIRPY